MFSKTMNRLERGGLRRVNQASKLKRTQSALVVACVMLLLGVWLPIVAAEDGIQVPLSSVLLWLGVSVCVVGATYAGWKVIKAVQKAYTDLLDTLKSGKQAADNANRIAEKTERAVEAAGAKASSLYDAWSILCIVMAALALCRNLYGRWTKSEKKEGKADVLSERDVFKAFDAAAVLCFIPLFAKDGWQGAYTVWRWVKTIGAMVKDACAGIHLFTRLFGGSKDDKDTADMPFIGIGLVDEIAAATTELVERVEEKKQMHQEEDFLAAARVALPADELEEKYPIPSPPLASPESSDGIPIAHPVLHCIQCKKEKCEHSGKPIYAKFFRAPVKQDAWTGLRKLWATQEDKAHLKKLENMATEKPWLLPVVVLVVFGSLLVLIRWMRERNSEPVPEQKKFVKALNKRERKEAEKTAKETEKPEGWFSRGEIVTDPKSGCCHTASCPLGDNRPKPNGSQVCGIVCGGHHCYHWAECEPTKTQEHQERKTAKSKKPGRKPWVDYSGDSDPQEVIYTDERGNLMHRVGRRAARNAEQAFMAKYSGKGNLTEQQEGKVVKLNKRHGFIAADPKKVGDKLILELPLGVQFEVREAEKTAHPKQKPQKEKSDDGEWKEATNKKSKKVLSQKKKELSKKMSAAEYAKYCADQVCHKCKQKGHIGKQCDKKDATNPSEKKEAIVNGPRFEIADVHKSVGRAVVKSNDIKSSLNCTMMWNGIVTSEHIFKDGGDEITFVFKDVQVTMPKSSGKVIGSDTMLFPRPKELESIPMLRASEGKPGQKVALICYDTEEDVKSGKWKQDQTVIKSVHREPDAEKAYYNASSIDGNCGAPVVDVFGKVVGWHNGTGAVDTFYIPVTPAITQRATSSVKSF